MATVRVFVSSTWIDLQPEQEAVEAVLHRMAETTHVGMKYFGSRAESTREVSLAEVDKSDVYIGIYAHRYGSGITEAEYRRAVERGLPLLLYIKHDDVLVRADHVEATDEGKQRLANFKKDVTARHTVPTFTTKDDLAAQVATDLHNLLLELQQLEKSTDDSADATAPPPRDNLPASVDVFIGRESELTGLGVILTGNREGQRLVTLTGIGGVGKTRLAVEAARQIVDAFPDGVWIIELASLQEASLLPQTVATSLGIVESPGVSAIDQLAGHLASKTLLLLIDNCEHLLAACRELMDRLLRKSPGLRVLATSRELLGISGEAVWPVHALASESLPSVPTEEELLAADATALFLARARAKQSDLIVTATRAAAIVGICRNLDGIPLAIELAAGWVPILSPEQIASRLSDRFGLLQRGNPLVPRHETLQAALDWSYNLLERREQVLFGRLSVFAGGWTLEAAEAVCPESALRKSDILPLLRALVDKSLISVEHAEDGPSRYLLLETVRQYSLSKLRPGQVKSLRRSHAAWAESLAEAEGQRLSGAGQAAALNQLAAEHVNLRAALRWSIAAENFRQAMRLCLALTEFWSVRGYFQEGRAWMQQVLSMPSASGQRLARARILRSAANLAAGQGDVQDACRDGEESLKIFREVGNSRGITLALGVLGRVAFDLGDYTTARKY